MKRIEDNAEFLGGFADYEFDTADSLVEIIQTLKELDDAEYQFVMINAFRDRGKAK